VKPVRISIRYCGGCNPDYDRTRLAADLLRALKGCCIVDDDPARADWIVMIHGCPTACAGTDGFPPDRCVAIRRPADAAVFIAGLQTGDVSRFAALRPHFPPRG